MAHLHDGLGDRETGCWRFGPFELDERRVELRRAGRRLPVQPKIFDLLVFLVKNRDRVVCKDELMDNVWPEVTVCEASLSQAVSLARKLLGDVPRAQRYLRTVRGRGFQFVAPLAPAPELPAAWSQAMAIGEGEQRCFMVRLIEGELHVFLLLGGTEMHFASAMPQGMARPALVAGAP